jgi:hypothetical protein
MNEKNDETRNPMAISGAIFGYWLPKQTWRASAIGFVDSSFGIPSSFVIRISSLLGK